MPRAIFAPAQQASRLGQVQGTKTTPDHRAFTPPTPPGSSGSRPAARSPLPWLAYDQAAKCPPQHRDQCRGAGLPPWIPSRDAGHRHEGMGERGAPLRCHEAWNGSSLWCPGPRSPLIRIPVGIPVGPSHDPSPPVLGRSCDAVSGGKINFRAERDGVALFRKELPLILLRRRFHLVPVAIAAISSGERVQSRGWVATAIAMVRPHQTISAWLSPDALGRPAKPPPYLSLGSVKGAALMSRRTTIPHRTVPEQLGNTGARGIWPSPAKAARHQLAGPAQTSSPAARQAATVSRSSIQHHVFVIRCAIPTTHEGAKGGSSEVRHPPTRPRRRGCACTTHRIAWHRCLLTEHPRDPRGRRRLAENNVVGAVRMEARRVLLDEATARPRVVPHAYSMSIDLSTGVMPPSGCPRHAILDPVRRYDEWGTVQYDKRRATWEAKTPMPPGRDDTIDVVHGGATRPGSSIGHGGAALASASAG
ncbi:uncharacterized protein PSFLO_03241 [Pseudozyma flocculosa]|uniref:Uncharacterized protein n=1 Tax=Pseudozyma flocculosa TaxID=84751 RepID=A0A5C3F177_9BASI|nr:uncharacterized protein PSFLO_03241 [Pseudozyma flocculosa]